MCVYYCFKYLTMLLDFKTTMYYHYLDLFHSTTSVQRSYARNRSNYYGRLIGLTESELRFDKLPRVDIAEIFGLKGNIAADGDE